MDASLSVTTLYDLDLNKSWFYAGKLMTVVVMGVLVSDLVLNHVADLRQKILADDAIEVAILWRCFVLDALCQSDPLFFCITHKGPGTSLTAWQKQRGETLYWFWGVGEIKTIELVQKRTPRVFNIVICKMSILVCTRLFYPWLESGHQVHFLSFLRPLHLPHH